MRRILLAPCALLILLSGCIFARQSPTPTVSADLVQTMVAATLAAFPSPTTMPSPVAPTLASLTATPSTPTLGHVSGKICYPTGANAMTVYFETADSHTVTDLPVSGNQPTYSIDLAPGSYLAYAWLNDFSLSGSYSRCGTAAGCNDAKPLSFNVLAGQTSTGIDICDWSHGPFDIPYPPGHDAQSTTGKISGSIAGYPYGSLPVLTVVAFNQGNGYWYWVGTGSGQDSYSIPELPPGTYQVVAYDSKNRAGGSPLVTVTAGKTVAANIGDWGGSYPDNPVH